jgi:hypothetical protein
MKKVLIRHIVLFVAGIFLIVGLISCRINVSLTGSNINPNAKTVSIATFINNVSSANPSLSQEFTTVLINKIQSQTPLTIVNNNGDYAVEGEIIGYNISPVAIQGNDIAAMNRLTITVRVRFTSKYDENMDFEQNFSRYMDYNITDNFRSKESGMVATINEALTDDIFNKAFVNW